MQQRHSLNQGEYTFLKPLSTAQFTEVWLATNAANEKVVLKLHKDLPSFQTEVKVYSDIDKNKNITRLIDSLQEADCIGSEQGPTTKVNALVLEYCPHGELHDFVTEEPFTEKEC